MKAWLRSLVRSLLAPALAWCREQVRGLDARLLALQGRLDEVAATNRAALETHRAEAEAVGRTLARQRDVLESIEAEQARLADQVAALAARLEAPARTPTGAHAPASTSTVSEG